jgi:hypothetical protein
MECPNCNREMVHIEVESTLMRNVFRCFDCRTIQSSRTALSWSLTGARLVLFLTTGIPDLTDFFG